MDEERVGAAAECEDLTDWTRQELIEEQAALDDAVDYYLEHGFGAALKGQRSDI